MENITVVISVSKLQEVVEKNISDILNNSYNNPVKTAIETVIKEQQGAIQEFVRTVITETLTQPEFKVKMGEIVMQRMVESSLKK